MKFTHKSFVFDINSSVEVKSCPLCGSFDFKSLFPLKNHIYSFRRSYHYNFDIFLMECNVCGLLFKDRYLSSSAESSISVSYCSSSTSRWGSTSFHPRFVNQLRPSPCDHVLEIGPGDASFSNSFSTASYLALLESPPHSDLNYNFVVGNLDALSLDTRFSSYLFDRIYLFDVFEHLASPAEFLSLLKDKLSSRGEIVLQTGNGLHRNFPHSSSYYYYNVPEHKIFLTPASLDYISKHYMLNRSSFFTFHKSYLSTNYLIKSIIRAFVIFPISILVSLFSKRSVFPSYLLPKKDHILAFLSV